jgi:hypothetical protein
MKQEEVPTVTYKIKFERHGYDPSVTLESARGLIKSFLSRRNLHAVFDERKSDRQIYFQIPRTTPEDPIKSYADQLKAELTNYFFKRKPRMSHFDRVL